MTQTMKCSECDSELYCPKCTPSEEHLEETEALAGEINRLSIKCAQAIELLRENRHRLAEEHALNVMNEDYHLPCPVCAVLTRTRGWLGRQR